MMLTPFERALVAHLVADWLLQNNWMAKNKSSLLHPAAWVHAAIYAGCLGLALGWVAGAVLGLLHVLIDTGLPVRWWTQKIKDSADAPEALHIAIWADQVVHIAAIAAWIAWAPVGGA
jgi:hypothetical protein